MQRKDYTEANRKAWDQVAPIHAQSNQAKLIANFKKSGFSVLDRYETEQLHKIGLVGKSVAQLACNNGRELLSIQNLGAEKVVGFDISEKFIQQANELKKAAGSDAEFVQSDIYEIHEKFYGTFDLVYISIGVLSWMPDLPLFFSIVSNLLRENGHVFIYEAHPFLNMLDVPNENSDNLLQITLSYFNKEATLDESGLDYFEGKEYKSLPNYWFAYTASDIIRGQIDNGLKITSFREYPHDISNEFKPLERFNKVPLSFILVSQKV